ncbi:hypothetical protein HY385_01425 [Candidatus Daviesbacteria bacterium]|nr:hypothetical protein [Candidatus Daviesbacteria bacterium]
MIDLSQQYGFGDVGSLGEGVQRLVEPTFIIATAAVTIYFIIGSFRFLISSGDKESVAKSRSMITHSIIGFILLILLFLIMQFIPEFLGINFSIIQK